MAARQYVSVRGADRRNPILLYVHGGPASVELPLSWAFQRPWEEYFTVVEWDQRAAGKSFLLNDRQTIAPTLVPDQYRDDAIELIELLRQRYGKRKIFLLGHSWGSTVALAVAVKRPDLLYAYVGMGQLIDFNENETASYAAVLAQARGDGNAQAVAELEAIAPYPGDGQSRCCENRASSESGRFTTAVLRLGATTAISICIWDACRRSTARPIAKHGTTAATSR